MFSIKLSAQYAHDFSTQIGNYYPDIGYELVLKDAYFSFKTRLGYNKNESRHETLLFSYPTVETYINFSKLYTSVEMRMYPFSKKRPVRGGFYFGAAAIGSFYTWIEEDWKEKYESIHGKAYFSDEPSMIK